jgi:hypothetical protein
MDNLKENCVSISAMRSPLPPLNFKQNFHPQFQPGRVVNDRYVHPASLCKLKPNMRCGRRRTGTVYSLHLSRLSRLSFLPPLISSAQIHRQRVVFGMRSKPPTKVLRLKAPRHKKLC